ncbi:hypothetical protein P7E02_05055 [Enterococcus hulanensis]|uniref:hypothetical protein n=1 Tax=Enterococcus hulanensis TaxID=2559929 RepID=UPI002892735C|nr:hypothetical protein [Enterococcus hulanensis]MDT2659224.1 hypothetical protein [Enterococcus hulanensis]
MVNYQNIINTFLVAYTEKDLKTMSSILVPDIRISFSNLGSFEGNKNVVKALTFEDNFSISSISTTGSMGYSLNDKYINAITAHHMVANEKYNILYPFTFGGKYVFVINNVTNLIEEIYFVLEYQAENTSYFINKWGFSTGKNEYDILESYDPSTFLGSLKFEKDTVKKIKMISSLFFWCLDTYDSDTIFKLITPDFFMQRDQSVGDKVFSCTKGNLQKFILDTKNYFDLDQNSLAINDIKLDDEVATVLGQHLTPHRLGTKKLNALTKYHTFFDEDIMIEFSKSDKSDLKIKKIVMTKAADVHYNRISILNY